MANAAYTANKDFRESWVSKPGRSRLGVSWKSTIFATLAVSAARPRRCGKCLLCLVLPQNAFMQQGPAGGHHVMDQKSGQGMAQAGLTYPRRPPPVYPLTRSVDRSRRAGDARPGRTVRAPPQTVRSRRRPRSTLVDTGPSYRSCCSRPYFEARFERHFPKVLSVRVLIAGASGFIGAHLARACAAAGHEVICGSRQPHAAFARCAPSHA